MIAKGDAAPDFSLPAVVGGDIEEVALGDYLGEDIVILAFYPADFNPCCSGETTDLDELDLFTMQKDVSILGISADSVYSHRAFAAEYDLHIPLLADVHAEVATDYGVAVEEEDAGHLSNRSVVVIDPGGEVQYAWQTDRLEQLPPVEKVREAVDDIGGTSTAEARHRVGHAHYVEGRRAFTKAMRGFEEMEWMMAQGDFTRAYEEFDEAADQFNTAVRFAEDEKARTYFERAEEKAEALWQAAEWLAEASSAYASGEGAKGEEMRSDAESPLETARDIHEPPDPDDFPPEEDPAERDEQDEESILPSDDDGPPASLEAGLDAAEPPEAEELADELTDDGLGDDETVSESGEATAATDTTVDSTTGPDERDANGDDADEIDEEELEEIAAELEEQTQQAQQKRNAEEGDDSVVANDPTSIVDEPPAESEDETLERDEGAATGSAGGDQNIDDPASQMDSIDQTASAGKSEVSIGEDGAESPPDTGDGDELDIPAEDGPTASGENDSGVVDDYGRGDGDDEPGNGDDERGDGHDVTTPADDDGPTVDGGETPGDERATDEDTDSEPDAEDIEGELDADDIELDLADPTEGTDDEPDDAADVDEEEDTDDDLDGGSHGVPDSL